MSKRYLIIVISTIVALIIGGGIFYNIYERPSNNSSSSNISQPNNSEDDLFNKIAKTEYEKRYLMDLVMFKNLFQAIANNKGSNASEFFRANILQVDKTPNTGRTTIEGIKSNQPIDENIFKSSAKFFSVANKIDKYDDITRANERTFLLTKNTSMIISNYKDELTISYSDNNGDLQGMDVPRIVELTNYFFATYLKNFKTELKDSTFSEYSDLNFMQFVRQSFGKAIDEIQDELNSSSSYRKKIVSLQIQNQNNELFIPLNFYDLTYNEDEIDRYTPREKIISSTINTLKRTYPKNITENNNIVFEIFNNAKLILNKDNLTAKIIFLNPKFTDTLFRVNQFLESYSNLFNYDYVSYRAGF